MNMTFFLWGSVTILADEGMFVWATSLQGQENVSKSLHWDECKRCSRIGRFDHRLLFHFITQQFISSIEVSSSHAVKSRNLMSKSEHNMCVRYSQLNLVNLGLTLCSSRKMQLMVIYFIKALLCVTGVLTWMNNDESCALYSGIPYSASFLAEISVSSPRKLFIFIIYKNIFWLKVSKKYFI